MYLLNTVTNELSFLLSRNRMVNRQLEGKSIPSLELQGIALGTEVLIETYKELCGESSVEPIRVEELLLFSDSVVCLSWINSYTNKLEKMSGRSIFVKNRLLDISKLCETFPVKYAFCAGNANPADLCYSPMLI